MKALRGLAVWAVVGMASALAEACASSDEPEASRGDGGAEAGAADATSDVALDTSGGGQAGGGTGGSAAGAGGQDGSATDGAAEADAGDPDAGQTDAGQADAACQGWFQDCDGNPANGCETDTSTSLQSCGACGKYCLPATGGFPSCDNGVCKITCAAGWGDCDGVLGNGCEVSLNANPNHCGACGHACASPCVNGACLADAGASDGGLGLDPSCVKPGVLAQCNPVTNQGCGSGMACDLGSNGGSTGFVCFQDGTQSDGQSCNNAVGPWCKAGLHCDETYCTEYCCSDSDCTGLQPSCKPIGGSAMGTIGACAGAADAGADASPPDGSVPDSGGSDSGIGDSGGGDAGFWLDPACVKPGSVVVQCNPVTNAGCQAGAACDLASNGTSAGFVCFPEGPKLEGEACNNAVGPWCKPTMNCDEDNLCHKLCCSDSDCTGTFKTCKALNPTTVGTFGLCE